jgi:carboxyl-terminal processing protease
MAFAAGVLADQNYADVIPVIRLPGQARSQVDRAAANQAARIIETEYYDPNLDPTRLSDGSVRGLVQALDDPFSAYLDPSQYQDQRDSYAGRHSGMIGITVSLAGDVPTITGILPGSPALTAGLRTGDAILRVDGRDTHGLPIDQVSALIRGPAGRSLTLLLRRDGSEMTVNLSRADFRSPTVVSADLGEGIAYFRVFQFGDATRQEFDDQLAARLPGARGMVLDLRGNGGGLVSAATAMISRFVSSGEAFEERSRDGEVSRTQVDGSHAAAGVPLVVLVDGDSASASEIVAGSLQVHHRARLIGARTFGKGSVQTDFVLSNGGDLHLTIEHWFLPDGRSVDRTGLAPDVAVAQPPEAAMFAAVQPALGHAGDAPLNRALDILAGR